jgi:hypothetical protein
VRRVCPAEAGDCNVITSRDTSATRTVRHLPLYLVPRTDGDGDGNGRKPPSAAATFIAR